ncbi:multidrug effflux MFS transporter [Afifella sp. IM 167]|uniref:multidrug effflux MFS transporter n=1 Tax=Afifella sp. IM 167 TaxID=2033586 RepID=UPI001CCBEE5D|nr:multidrug effflux MFS transporter [Afifella sp. IM 167]
MTDATVPAQPGRRPSLISLVIISALSPFAINVVVPSMPALQDEFSADFGHVQLVLSLFLASVALSQIGIGPLSDRFGRRPVLLAGLCIFTLASIVAIMVSSIETLIGLRIVQAAGGCTGIVLARAIVRDLYDRRKAASVIGYVTMGLAMGPMVAPLVGGLLQQGFGWRAQFICMALLGAIVLFVAWRDVGETNHHLTERLDFATMRRDFARLLREPAFLVYTAVSSLSTAVFFSFLGGAAYVAETIIGLSPVSYGSWFAIIAIGYAFGNFLSGRFAERVGVRRMTLGGSILLVAAVAVMGLLFAAGYVVPAALFVPMCIGSAANGLVLPSTIAGAVSVRPEIAGAAAGLQGACQIGAGAVLSAIAGAALAGSASPMPLVVVMGVCSIAALFFAAILFRVVR